MKFALSETQLQVNMDLRAVRLSLAVLNWVKVPGLFDSGRTLNGDVITYTPPDTFGERPDGLSFLHARRPGPYRDGNS